MLLGMGRGRPLKHGDCFAWFSVYCSCTSRGYEVMSVQFGSLAVSALGLVEGDAVDFFRSGSSVYMVLGEGFPLYSSGGGSFRLGDGVYKAVRFLRNAFGLGCCSCNFELLEVEGGEFEKKRVYEILVI